MRVARASDEHRCERARVADGEPAGVSTAEDADGARDARSDDGNVRGDRLGEDVGASFGPRREHEQVCAREGSTRLRGGSLTDPSITIVAPHGRDRGAAHGVGERSTDVNDLHPDVARDETKRTDDAKRIFDRTQVTDDEHAQRIVSVLGTTRGGDPRRRLRNEARLVSCVAREIAGGVRVEDDETIGDLERAACGAVAREIAIEVGAGEGDDDGELRARSARARDDVGGFSRVQGDEQIAARVAIVERGDDADAMTEGSQDAPPAKGGDAIADA